MSARAALEPTKREASAANAIRRSRRCTNIASASMKPPMKTKTTGSANDANTWRAGATCRAKARNGAGVRGVGGGSGPHTHNTPTAGGDGERQRLAHPQHDDRGQDGGETVRRGGEAERRRQQRDEHGGREEKSGRPPDVLDARLDL